MKRTSQLYPSIIALVGAATVFSATVQATTIPFTTDPFAGSDALTTPGRQVVGGELQINFSIATDVFAFDPAIFKIGSIQFANDVVGNLPSSGVNVVVLRTFDNDGNPATPFGAGNAANLIAEQITTPGPGFFVYFNSGLNLPRLVYSTDLNDNQADLKVLARFLNLTGQDGRDAFPTISASNFELLPVPETTNSMLLLVIGAGAVLGAGSRLPRRHVRG